MNVNQEGYLAANMLAMEIFYVELVYYTKGEMELGSKQVYLLITVVFLSSWQGSRALVCFHSRLLKSS